MNSNNYLVIAKYVARFIYAFLKLLPTNNKVVMISRFHRTTSVDFKLLIEEINNINYKTKVIVLNHKLRSKKLLIIDVLKEMYHLATSKAAIIDSYIIPVSVLKHKRKLVIVQIWHAIGVTKKFGYEAIGTKEGVPRDMARIMHLHENYTYITTGGKKSVPIYKDCFKTDAKVLNCGLPRMDYLVNWENQINVKNKLFVENPSLLRKKNILYTPTFRKGAIIPYNDIIEKVDFKKYNLIIKKHPLDKSKIKDERVLFLEGYDTLDLLFIADYLITDYSAICFEAALLDIPMFFYTYDINIYNKNRGLYIDMMKDAPGFSSKNAGDIISAIEKKKYNLQVIRDFKNEHLDYVDGTCGKRIVSLLNLEVAYEKQVETIPVRHI